MPEYGPDGELLTAEEIDRQNEDLGLQIHESEVNTSTEPDYSNQIEQNILNTLK